MANGAATWWLGGLTNAVARDPIKPEPLLFLRVKDICEVATLTNKRPGGGGEAPHNILEFFRLFFTIFVLVKLFFPFLGGPGAKPLEIFEIFQFSDARGGLPRIFPDFLMSEKNREGGWSEENFFLTSFLRPLSH